MKRLTGVLALLLIALLSMASRRGEIDPDPDFAKVLSRVGPSALRAVSLGEWMPPRGIWKRGIYNLEGIAVSRSGNLLPQSARAGSDAFIIYMVVTGIADSSSSPVSGRWGIARIIVEESRQRAGLHRGLVYHPLDIVAFEGESVVSVFAPSGRDLILLVLCRSDDPIPAVDPAIPTVSCKADPTLWAVNAIDFKREPIPLPKGAQGVIFLREISDETVLMELLFENVREPFLLNLDTRTVTQTKWGTIFPGQDKYGVFDIRPSCGFSLLGESLSDPMKRPADFPTMLFLADLQGNILRYLLGPQKHAGVDPDIRATVSIRDAVVSPYCNQILLLLGDAMGHAPGDIYILNLDLNRRKLP
jgi:hypothetical protein